MKRHRTSFPVLLTALLLTQVGACGPAPSTETDVAEERAEQPVAPVVLVAEDGLPGEAYAVLASDGAWSRFSGPRAITDHGERTLTYAGLVNSAGDAVLAQFDQGSGVVESVVIKEQLQQDDRAAPVILARPDHRLMAFYCGHRGRWMVYATSAGPEDIASWGRPRAASGHSSEFAGYSYPNAVALSGEDDRKYVFWRGTDNLPMFTFTETWMTWSEPAVLLQTEDGAPFLKVASDGVSTIHFAFTDDHPGSSPSSIYYLCYRDGVFCRADGSPVGTMEDLPLTFEDADLVHDASDTGLRTWVWDVAFGPSGNPVIAYAAFPAEDDHRYRYAAWDGEAWSDAEVTPAGGWFPAVEKRSPHLDVYASGGMALDPVDPSVLYLSRPVAGVFEIERWTTLDGGRAWTSQAVTSGSAFDNVRPVVPLDRVPGGPGLIWMNGTYSDRSTYSTSLRMK